MSDTTNPLLFQYQVRAATVNELQGDERRMANEQRDRELEDYLGYLQQKVDAAAAATAELHETVRQLRDDVDGRGP